MAATAHVEMQASAGEEFRTVLLDTDDYLRLGGRSLSVGSHGYAQVWMDRKVQTLHRWLFDLSGQGYTTIVDHLNRDRLDNRRQNLRLVDGSRSNANRSPADARYTGVYRTRSGRYQAKFKWRGERIHLGTFDSRDAAADALLRYRQVHVPESMPPAMTVAA